jgi:HEAT repeat protein
MIDLICPKCATKLPVAENKIGTRLFVCPQCAHPLEAPATPPIAPPNGKTVAPAHVDHSEDKTVAPDPSLAHVQAKLRAIAEKRAGQPPAEPVVAAPAISKGVLLGGIGVAGIAVIGVILLVLAGGGLMAFFLLRGKPSPAPVAQQDVTTAPPKVKEPPKEKEPPTVAALTNDVKEGMMAKRKAALKELSNRGLDARPALKVVLPFLADPDRETRSLAAEVLAAMGPADKDDVAIYGAALRSSLPDVRAYAAKRLGELGQQAKDELVYLRVLALEDNKVVQEAAEKAVQRIEEPLLATFIKGLRDRDSTERGRAAKGIADMGEHGRAALPALVEMLADPNVSVRENVANAFVAIGPEGVPVLDRAMRDRNPQVRQEAIETLGRMGTDAIPCLITALSTEKNVATRQLLIKLVEQIGPNAAPALEAALAKSKAEETKDINSALERMKRQRDKPRPDLVGRAGLIQANLRAWFKVQDANKDGFLDKEELAHAFRGASAKAYDVTYPNKQFGLSDYAKFPDYYFLMHVDRDNDGKVSQSEFEYWAYDYAICLEKELDERDKIAQAQRRLQEQHVSDAMRVEREDELRKVWANYNNWRNAQAALNRDLNQLQWLQRWELEHQPKPK